MQRGSQASHCVFTADVPLSDGEAHHMGDGVFIVFQDVDGTPNSVVLTPADLAKMLGLPG